MSYYFTQSCGYEFQRNLLTSQPQRLSTILIRLLSVLAVFLFKIIVNIFLDFCLFFLIFATFFWCFCLFFEDYFLFIFFSIFGQVFVFIYSANCFPFFFAWNSQPLEIHSSVETKLRSDTDKAETMTKREEH